MSVMEMKMFLTRIGKGCKVVVAGDIKQSDLKAGSDCGLAMVADFIKRGLVYAPIIEFGVNDIVRSDICKRWIMAFEGDLN